LGVFGAGHVAGVIATGDDPGDMTSAENPQALDSIRAALE